jgi:serine/threonine protein kinase
MAGVPGDNVDEPTSAGGHILGRYALHGEIASGGMATVYLGRLIGPVGFSRIVAIKRLHAQFAKDPEFAALFFDEARLVARIRHPNVIPTVDVVASRDELFLVMEYVEGESLARLLRTVIARDEQLPLPIVSAILTGVLHGLHAAHEARDERGASLEIVHRDVSPQNVLLGRDGVPRLLDFGVAKALGRSHTTQGGQLKGKLGYMSPEQLLGRTVTRQADIFAAGVVLWELVARQRLFTGESEGAIIQQVLYSNPPRLSGQRPDVPEPLLRVVERSLARAPEDRFASAREMADALEGCVTPATVSQSSRWVEQVASSSFVEQAERVARMEAGRPSGRGRISAPGTTSATQPAPGSLAGHVQSHGVPPVDELSTRRAPEPRLPRPTDSQVSGVSVRGPQDVAPRSRKGALPLATLLIVPIAVAIGFVIAQAKTRSTDGEPSSGAAGAHVAGRASSEPSPSSSALAPITSTAPTAPTATEPAPRPLPSRAAVEPPPQTPPLSSVPRQVAPPAPVLSSAAPPHRARPAPAGSAAASKPPPGDILDDR